MTESLAHDALQSSGPRSAFRNQAELHRTIFQELGNPGKIFRHHGLPVGLYVEIVAIGKGLLQRRRHPPHIASFQRQAPNRR